MYTVDPNDPNQILLKRTGRLVTPIDIFINRTYGQGQDNQNNTKPYSNVSLPLQTLS